MSLLGIESGRDLSRAHRQSKSNLSINSFVIIDPIIQPAMRGLSRLFRPTGRGIRTRRSSPHIVNTE